MILHPNPISAQPKAVFSPRSFLLTGLSGAGKTSLATRAQECLQKELDLIILDGDELRKGLTSDLGFTPKDRHENIRRCGEMAKLLAKQNKITLLSVIAPYASLRNTLMNILGPNLLRIIHINCPLEVCISRDPKRNYQKALGGALPNYTGLSDVYEEPCDPHLVIHTHQSPQEECAQTLINYIRKEVFGSQSQ